MFGFFLLQQRALESRRVLRIYIVIELELTIEEKEAEKAYSYD